MRARSVAASVSKNSLAVLRERYLRRDEAGGLAEDPQGMLGYVPSTVAGSARIFCENAAFWEERFLERRERFEFLPNSPTLMNAGLPGGQLAACFVLPVEDNLESIFAALSRTARIRQFGGGSVFSFSALRRRGFSTLRNASATCIAPTGTISLIAGCSSGIEPFFALVFTRRVLDGRVMIEINPMGAPRWPGAALLARQPFRRFVSGEAGDLQSSSPPMQDATAVTFCLMTTQSSAGLDV